MQIHVLVSQSKQSSAHPKPWVSCPDPPSSPSTIHDDGDYQPLATNTSVCLLGITVPRGPTRRAVFVPCNSASFSSWRLMAACCRCGLYSVPYKAVL